MTFEEWMADVKRIIEYEIGPRAQDVPPMPYAAEYAAGTSSADMARLAIVEAW